MIKDSGGVEFVVGFGNGDQTPRIGEYAVEEKR